MWLDKLREMKERSGLTTREIADKSGLPEPTLEKIFAGATKDPKLTTIQQLVHFLGYTLDDLDGVKKSPDMTIAMSGESNNYVSIEESTRLLVALGLIDKGQQLTDDDIAFMGHVLGMLDTWFSSKRH